MEHRRELKDGELVTVDLSIACGAGGMKDGVVVGKSTTGLLDYYMVDFGETFPSYPYKVVNIPHIAIVDE